MSLFTVVILDPYGYIDYEDILVFDYDSEEEFDISVTCAEGYEDNCETTTEQYTVIPSYNLYTAYTTHSNEDYSY